MKNKKFILIGLLGLCFLFFSFQDRFFEIAKQIEIYNNLYKILNINYIDEINPGDLTNKAINNTLKNLDPYTRFYNEQQVEDARIQREGEYAGMGISTMYVNEGIVIANIRQGYPADKAGLKVGDIITSVNNQKLKGLEKDQLSQVLKGSPGTPITLSIRRGKKTKTVNSKLDKIEIHPVPYYEMINAETGYIKLTQFINTKATAEVKKAIISLEEKGMKKLVFDLRSNPGGSLFDAINIVNLFIEKGKKVVDTRGKTKRNTHTYTTKNLPLDLKIPLVVLIDGHSASASEIVSGALQDYDRAVVMGERSFGKGLVQRYFNLNYGTQMKATISKYYTPSGRCIQELDYANRNPKTGEVPKFSDGPVNVFKTTKGRTVYDGGGITPDVKINQSTKTKETKTLLKSTAIFNFATAYIRQHPTADINSYAFRSDEFNQFTKYLKTKDTAFITKQEKLFKKAYKTVKNKNKITQGFHQISEALKDEKIDKISKNKDIIIPYIQNEILERYFYEKGKYKYLLNNDKTIKKAVALLNKPREYYKILGK